MELKFEPFNSSLGEQPHPAQASDPGTPEKIEETGLYLIIGMVS